MQMCNQMPKRKSSGTYGRNTRRKRGAGRYRRRSKMNTKLMMRVARRAVLKNTETKFVTYAAQNGQLNHDTPTHIINNLLATTQGQTQFTRVGDEVYPIGVKFKLWLSNKLDRPNVMYRVIFYRPTTDTVGSNAIPANFWVSTANNNKLMEYINTDKYTVVKDITINPKAGDYSLESGATNRERSFMKQFWFPSKGPLKYQTDNGNVPKFQKHCLSLIVCAYDAYGTLTTDTIASCSWSYKFYFKDP